MKYTAEGYAPCKVFDANGLEWRDLAWVDSDTGEGEQLLRDEGGNWMVDRPKGEVCRAMVRLATPVLVKPMSWEQQTGWVEGASMDHGTPKNA
jgi:hypothetical protein